MTDYTRGTRELLRHREIERANRRRRAIHRRAILGAQSIHPPVVELTRSAEPHIATTPVWMWTHVRVAQVLDFVVAVIVATVAYLLRFGSEADRNLIVVGLTPFLWVGVLWASGAYSKSTVGVGSEEYRSIGRSFFLTLAAVAIASYVSNAQLARAFVLPTLAVVPLGTLAVHWSLRLRLHNQRVRGENLRDTVVVGRVGSIETMITSFQNSPVSGYRVVGACVTAPDGSVPKGTICQVPIVGAPADALVAVDTLRADVVAVSSDPDLQGHSLRRFGWSLAERGVDLVVSPGIVEVAGPRLAMRPVAGLSMLHVERPVDGGARALFKRAMDALLAAVLLVVTAPLWLLAALAVATTSRGPVFFLQERVGANGRPFRMIKFRTMVRNAEELLESMSRDGHVNAVLFKEKADPRITRVGHVLRRYSIDELPQLLNVLRGEMSLIGPRPPLASEVAQYESDAVQRLRVRPGMTGLWQVSGRSDLDWEESLRLDLWYVDNWSPLLDLQILVGTVRAVITSRGAY